MTGAGVPGSPTDQIDFLALLSGGLLVWGIWDCRGGRRWISLPCRLQFGRVVADHIGAVTAFPKEAKNGHHNEGRHNPADPAVVSITKILSPGRGRPHA